jgi:EmrB/QacA subfamily drug resistance transporter
MSRTTTAPSFLATRRGRLTLLFVCAVALLDLLDATVVNVALPSMQRGLHLSVSDLQWVPNGYLLTYGGFMLLGGRAGDLISRRRFLVSGIVVIGTASLVGGLASSGAMLVGARMAQGLGAALTMPSTLAVLTTSLKEGEDRHAAFGVYGAIGGLGSAVGVLLGGLLTEGPGWRWVFFINPIAAALLIVPAFRLVSAERNTAKLRSFDARGAVLATGAMLLLVFAIVEAPSAGWGSVRTVDELLGALGLLSLFVANELRHPNPLAPLSMFRINGLGFSDVTQFTTMAGFIAMFFFLTLYMQDVLHYSAIKTALSYLPLCFAIGGAATASSRLLSRLGTRAVIVAGAIVTAGGLYWLSRIPVHGSYVSDLLPGMLVLSVGVGPVFVAVTTAANAGVPREKAGLAAALLNASQQVGAALGLAVLTVVATDRTRSLGSAHVLQAHAETAGFLRVLLVGSIFCLAAAAVGLRATNTQGETKATSNLQYPLGEEALGKTLLASTRRLSDGASARAGTGDGLPSPARTVAAQLTDDFVKGEPGPRRRGL